MLDPLDFETNTTTLEAIGNLTLTYKSQERLRGAEELGMQMLTSARTILGENHSNSLAEITDLAVTCQSQERLKESENLTAELPARSGIDQDKEDASL